MVRSKRGAFLLSARDVTIHDSLINFRHICGILISETKQGGNQYGEIHPLREAFQEGKAQDGPGQASNLGRTESRHPQAGKQQGLQQKKVAELEAGITAYSLRLFLSYRVMKFIKKWNCLLPLFVLKLKIPVYTFARRHL